jgi:hypothetical protein
MSMSAAHSPALPTGRSSSDPLARWEVDTSSEAINRAQLPEAINRAQLPEAINRAQLPT